MIYHHLQTELTLLLRRSHTWLYPLCFFSVVICLFPFAFTPDPVFLTKYIPGCIWIAALLASLLSIETIFFTDLEDGYLDQLLLSDTPLSAIIFLKLTAHWLMTGLPLVVLTLVLSLLFNLSLSVTMALCVSLLAGTPILILIGALAAALTIGLHQPGALLGLLILPLIIPVLIFGVNITQQMAAGFSIAAPLAFLTGISLLTIVFLPWAIAAALRIGMDG